MRLSCGVALGDNSFTFVLLIYQGLRCARHTPVCQKRVKLTIPIYADKAVSKACVNCHNNHILSSNREHKLGDVMGGIIISFPLPLE